MTVRETVKAHKTKFHADDLGALFAGATKLHAARGKSAVTFDLRKDDATEIAARVLGRSGTLRAPAVRRGKTWLVGFHEETWTAVLA